MDKKAIDNIQKFRGLCVQNARDLLSAANEIKTNQAVKLHLAILALEEVGKCSLYEAQEIIKAHKKDYEGFGAQLDDHVRKLFWALWSPVGQSNILSKIHLEQSQQMASLLHQQRLNAVYVDEGDETVPSARVTITEADTVIGLAEAAVEIKTHEQMEALADDAIDAFKWFLEATNDPQIRKMIFSAHSLQPLIAGQSTREWIMDLYGRYLKDREETSKLLADELARKAPTSEEQDSPKFKVKVRLYTASHVVRDAHLAWWNKSVNDVKLRVAKKGRKHTELIMETVLRKSTALQDVWLSGWHMTNVFIWSINVGTGGFFWYSPPTIEQRYWEEILDLEHDGKGIVAQPREKTAVDWGQERRNFDMTAQQRALQVFIYFRQMMDNPSFKESVQEYNTGIACIAKSDFSLRLDAGALGHLYKAFKKAMEAHSLPTDDSAILDAFITETDTVFADVNDVKNVFKKAQDIIVGTKIDQLITPEEVYLMKICYDGLNMKMSKKIVDEMHDADASLS